jgi:hypothetical protein
MKMKMNGYKPKDSGMIDNRMVKDNHQGGIERVKQRGYDKRDCEGHDGKMGKKIPNQSNWNRRGDSLTPRKA